MFRSRSLFAGAVVLALTLAAGSTAHGQVGAGLLDANLVPEAELAVVRRFLEEKISIDPFPYLKQGDRVYVRSGPFQGVEGFIVRKDRHMRLVISLDLLMQSISVVIDEAVVEKV